MGLNNTADFSLSTSKPSEKDAKAIKVPCQEELLISDHWDNIRTRNGNQFWDTLINNCSCTYWFFSDKYYHTKNLLLQELIIYFSGLNTAQCVKR